MPPPAEATGIPWWKFWDDGIVKEPPAEPSDEEVAALDEQLDKRQGFIVVYSVAVSISIYSAE